MNLARAVSIAWHINTLVVFALIVRMLALGLRDRFPMFLTDRAVTVGFGVVGLFLSTSSTLYCHIFLYSRPFDLLIIVLAAREVFHEVYRTNPGLREMVRNSRRSAIVGAVTAAVAAVPFTYPKWACAEVQCWSFVVVEIQRAVFLGMAIYLILIQKGMKKTNVWIDHNTRLHSRLFTVWLLAVVTMGVLALVAKGTSLLPWLNLSLLSAHLTLNCHWFFGLARSSSIEPSPVSVDLPATVIERLRSLDTVLQEARSRPNRAPQRLPG